jgi:hypothetical protein
LGDLEREGQDVGPAADAAEGPIESADLRVVDQRDLDDTGLAAGRA